MATSATSGGAENAAINPVTVVPMLAPTTNGNRSRMWNLPDAASGTVSDVVVEEDCTAVVMTAPESTPERVPLPSAACRNSCARPTSSVPSMLPMNPMTTMIRAMPPIERMMPPHTWLSGLTAVSARETSGSVMASTKSPMPLKIVLRMPPDPPLV